MYLSLLNACIFFGARWRLYFSGMEAVIIAASSWYLWLGKCCINTWCDWSPTIKIQSFLISWDASTTVSSHLFCISAFSLMEPARCICLITCNYIETFKLVTCELALPLLSLLMRQTQSWWGWIRMFWKMLCQNQGEGWDALFLLQNGRDTTPGYWKQKSAFLSVTETTAACLGKRK